MQHPKPLPAETVDPVLAAAVAGLAPLASLNATASFFGVTTRTVRRWIRLGKLRASRTSLTGSGRVLVARAEIARVLASMAQTVPFDGR